MPQIGQFTRLRGIFTGTIRTLTFDRHIVLVPTNQADVQGQPHYTIHLKDADGPEVGVAWKKTGDRAGEYVSLSLDDPTLPAPIRANLFQRDADKKEWVLIWKRENHRTPRTDEANA
ncbi:DUF736 domain-containing protein [Asticcacaulis sp.]|uniref:DUF736 domain-containing protein n=1 Tax=Asticcacaulis sp. TaxID=1872648 RepID=UPI002CA04991|nr:DUF736 domain-containing protein [Asticcacaulis sp.]HTM82188.1 DUF736 domain-containing protein [Asticcacaulis sp.]